MKATLCLTFFGIASYYANAAVVAYGPTRYLQASDSPWYQGIQNGSFYLEDFRDGLLNTPFVSSNGEIRGLGDKRSVDADDGVLDGNGQCCGTWWVEDGEVLELAFEHNEQNLLPAFVGIVITKTARSYERISVSTLGDANLKRFRFDLTSLFEKSNVNFLFDSSEAQFVGFYAPEGIVSISFEAARYFDHLQYGYAVPEPVSAALAGLGAGSLLIRRRRKQQPAFE